ncbi:MAG: transcriptional repressor LexA [Planctomycetota bacterium]
MTSPNLPNLTPKQKRILTLIRESRLAHGYSPTMQELGDELGVSKVTVFEHVEALIKKGCLTRDPNKARSLELSPDLELPDETRHTRFPLVGSIAAGSPIEAIEDSEHFDLEQVFAPSNLSGSDSSTKKFVLKVRGDSMIDEHIADGDFVLCEQRNVARNGQTVVALLDTGEATLKTYFREKNGTVRLQPANDNYEPLIVPEHQVQIQGILIGVIRVC